MRLARLCLLVLFAVLGVIPVAIRAETFLVAGSSANARDTHIDIRGMGDFADPDAQVSPTLATLNASLSSHAAHGVADGVVTVEAHAAVGDLGIHMSGVAAVTRVSASAQASANASVAWIESIKILAPFFPPNTSGLVTFDLFLDGEISVAAVDNGAATISFDLEDRGSSASLPPEPLPDVHLWGFGVANPNTHILEQIPGGIRCTMAVNLGRDFELGYEMTMGGSAFSDFQNLDRIGLGGFSGDVSGSLHWGGIESITGPGGIVIPRDQWSITSESGFDYSRSFDEQQIPEPSSVVLLGFALCLWLGRARTRGWRS